VYLGRESPSKTMHKAERVGRQFSKKTYSNRYCELIPLGDILGKQQTSDFPRKNGDHHKLLVQQSTNKQSYEPKQYVEPQRIRDGLGR